jgi:signal transduction histidine kinase
METFRNSLFIDALLPLITIIFVIGIGVIFLYQNFQKNLFNQRLMQETLKNIHQNDLLRSSIEAQEEERKHIAQDLHDELGAVLSIMRMNMVMLEQQCMQTGDNKLQKLQNMRMLSETALVSVRNISHRLMPPQLQAFGLIKTLTSVIQQINNAEHINIELIANTTDTDMSWSMSLGLYRIVMELINNTIRHAEATHVIIEIDRDRDHRIICQYSDNGIGLINADIKPGSGHKNIHGRISSLGGTIEICSGNQKGFSAVICIPVKS